MDDTELLQESASVTLDAFGNGKVTLGPVNQFQVWYVTNEGTTVSSNVNEPTFRYYRSNGLSAGAFVAGSNQGSADSDDSPVTLYPGQKLTGLWSGGDPGATATFTLQGTMTLRG
jgi:hypothetical protein